MEKKFEQKVAETLTSLFELYPLDLSGPRKETNAAMREALARMYADVALRSYLENAIRDANKALIASHTTEQHMFYKSRMETLGQLLLIGKNHFIHSEIKRSMKEPLKAVESEITEIKL